MLSIAHPHSVVCCWHKKSTLAIFSVNFLFSALTVMPIQAKNAEASAQRLAHMEHKVAASPGLMT